MTNPTVTIKPKIEVGQVWVDGLGNFVEVVKTDRRTSVGAPVLGLRSMRLTESDQIPVVYGAAGEAYTTSLLRDPARDLIKLYIPPKTYTAYCLQYVARDQLHVIAFTTAARRDDIARRYSGDDWVVSHIETFERTITVEG